MSLNGLEATEVNEAYQSALGEGGGWYVDAHSFRTTTLALITSYPGCCSSTPTEMK